MHKKVFMKTTDWHMFKEFKLMELLDAPNVVKTLIGDPDC